MSFHSCNFVHKTDQNKSIAMFVKHTYNEIIVIHFVNLRNKLPIVVPRSELGMLNEHQLIDVRL